MNKHLSKDQIRNPDMATQKLQAGFQWTHAHMKLVIGAFFALIIGGGGWSAWQWNTQRQERSAYEKFYQSERDYVKKKEDFDLYDSSLKAIEEKKKDSKNPTQKKNAKLDPKAKVEEDKPQGQKSTGDMDQDFGSVVKGFNETIESNPGSAAAHLAALNLSTIQLKYGNIDQGLSAFDKLNIRGDMLGSLVQYQKAKLFADKKDYKAAIGIFEQVAKNQSVSFLHTETQMKMAFCFEALNEPQKAIDVYQKIILDEKDSSAGKMAQKYLRLLQLQKN